MYDIEYTLEALEDLKRFRKYEQQQIVDQIDEQLSDEPSHETRNRKRLRPNTVAEFELRITRFRVFYDVDENENLVKIESVGHKEGSHLFICGKEYQL
jgi:mRNA-degrading endonuclease RelE of RelBE toxin-antitoxin system